MARRQSHPVRGTSAPETADDGRRKVERLMEKGNVKEAFKEAKYLFRQQASPEHRQLVERTYLLRVQALLHGGMDAAAREVTGSLLEFGVTDGAIKQELVLLLPQVGLAQKALSLQDGLESPELQAKLIIKLVDRAVTHPAEIEMLPEELRGATGWVHQALEALEANQNGRAVELLQPIPRTSPLADWRYFVRGLAAFRQEEWGQARANWDRLEPDRSAQKISRALLAAADSQAGAGSSGSLHALELAAFGEPVLERLGHLRRALETSDPKRAVQIVGPLRRSLGQIDPSLAIRLTEAVLPLLCAELLRHSYQNAMRLLKDFTKVLEPLPWDPHWNRFQALVWEGPQGDPSRAIEFWKKYTDDLAQGAAAHVGKPDQVLALVWRRIGELTAELEDYDDERWDQFEDAPEDEQHSADDPLHQANEALTRSLMLDPTQRKTYQLLIENYDSLGDSARAAETLNRLLQAFPEDVDALRDLIQRHQSSDQPDQMLSALERLRVLRPLDPTLPQFEVWARLARVRHLALAGRWDEGRLEFVRFESTPALQVQIDQTRLLTRRAAFEFKAKNLSQAEEFVTQARSANSSQPLVSCWLAIEAARYKLPKPLQKRFDQEFKTSLLDKVNSAAAGGLSETMAQYLIANINYTGRAGHVKEIVRYLRRTNRMKYAERDLRHACLLLQALGNQSRLFATLIQRGRKLFPRSPFFLAVDVANELAKGPDHFRPGHFRRKLQEALTVAEASPDAADAPLVDMIKETLTRVDDLEEVMSRSRFPFFTGMPSGMPQSIHEIFDEITENFGWEDEPDDTPPRQPQSHRPR